MEVTTVMGASLMIGSSIFLYIVALIIVLAFFGYLTYRVSPKGKARREERRNRRK
ncbi:hypothetical protein [uncultured Psychrobacter sp.]|uniref:hypothetical protein n=1 Tax=unclassified Psychrobacter TaxID=196806 RepID=UPI00293D43FD|nr:hypothetical protein [uncultured Psychrobacter sp.]